MKTLLKIGEMIQFLPGAMKDAINSVAKDAGQKTDDMELHRHSHSEKARTNQLEPGKREAIKYVSYRTQDRDDEIVIPEALDLKSFRRYAHVLVNHNYSTLPVGSDLEINADDFGIVAHTKYADCGEGSLANVVWALVSQGHMKASSVGFVPLSYTKPGARDWDHVANQLQTHWPEFSKEKAEKSISRIITKGVLLEHSDVSVPCNADAELISVCKGMVSNKSVSEKVARELGWWEMSEDADSGLTLVQVQESIWKGAMFPCGPDGLHVITQKPYPSEHSARQTDPGKYKKFARQNDKGGKGVHFIFGIKDDGKTELQSVHFSKDQFTPEQAKAWLEKHKMKSGVEAATGGSEKTVTIVDKGGEGSGIKGHVTVHGVKEGTHQADGEFNEGFKASSLAPGMLVRHEASDHVHEVVSTRTVRDPSDGSVQIGVRLQGKKQEEMHDKEDRVTTFTKKSTKSAGDGVAAGADGQGGYLMDENSNKVRDGGSATRDEDEEDPNDISGDVDDIKDQMDEAKESKDWQDVSGSIQELRMDCKTTDGSLALEQASRWCEMCAQDVETGAVAPGSRLEEIKQYLDRAVAFEAGETTPRNSERPVVDEGTISKGAIKIVPSIKVMAPPTYVRVISSPPDPEAINKMVQEIVIKSIAKRRGKIL